MAFLRPGFAFEQQAQLVEAPNEWSKAARIRLQPILGSNLPSLLQAIWSLSPVESLRRLRSTNYG